MRDVQMGALSLQRNAEAGEGLSGPDLSRPWARRCLLPELEKGAFTLSPAQPGWQEPRASPEHETACTLDSQPCRHHAGKGVQQGKPLYTDRMRLRASADLASGYFMSLTSRRSLPPDLHLEQVFQRL